MGFKSPTPGAFLFAPCVQRQSGRSARFWPKLCQAASDFLHLASSKRYLLGCEIVLFASCTRSFKRGPSAPRQVGLTLEKGSAEGRCDIALALTEKKKLHLSLNPHVQNSEASCNFAMSMNNYFGGAQTLA